MKFRLVLASVLIAVVTTVLACGGDKPPMVPDQDQQQPAQADAAAD